MGSSEDLDGDGGRNLVVGEHAVGGADESPIGVIEREDGVRAGCHDDLVLAARPDGDDRDPGWLTVGAPDVGRVDPLRLQRGDGALAIGVSPDQADHAHPDAGASGGDRLVGSLPTVMARETSAEHGLAG